jgi:hypothetical protein
VEIADFALRQGHPGEVGGGGEMEDGREVCMWFAWKLRGDGHVRMNLPMDMVAL